jgi:large subunit ribosomal protein L30
MGGPGVEDGIFPTHSLANYPICEFNKTMAKIKITQVKSGIDRSERQKRTLVALGLRKMLASVEVEATPQIRGMVEKVHHLVKVEELAG